MLYRWNCLRSWQQVWFQQTEAQFALRGITDSTIKYFYLLTALDLVVAERMAGDVEVRPERNPVVAERMAGDVEVRPERNPVVAEYIAGDVEVRPERNPYKY